MSAPARPRLAAATTVLRAALGTALLTSAEPLLGELGGRPPDAGARVFARVLGARHLVEAGLLAHAPSKARLRAGALVDGIHAVTALVLAERRHHRRLAETNAVSAALLAAAGLTAAGSR